MNADILLVDDTPENLRLLMQLLKNQGYKVRAASNGPHALASADANPPDVILLDVNMPGMDGFEVCSRLKANKETREIPVIFISAFNELPDKVRGFEVGGVDYISKPFQAAEVLSRVKAHLSLYQFQKQLEEKNAELEESRRRLELKNTELKHFAGTVSHDLKAPLRGLSRLVHWLVEDYADAFDEKGREMTGMLLERVKHMEELINGILQYSRAGHSEGQKELIDLNALVKHVLSVLEPPEHIRMTVEPELPCIWGETTSMQQIFQNLLGNAISYMDKAEGEIYVRSARQDRGWIVSIADNGPGIEEQYHENIFNIFQTAGTGNRAEKNGIGLAIVQKVVESYGGKIWLESIPGKGSEFFFTLPGEPAG